MFDYSVLKSVSSEAKSKLEDIRPKTLSQASNNRNPDGDGPFVFYF